MEMELENNPTLSDEYVGDITRELDRLAGLTVCDDLHHYIYIDKNYYKDKHLLVRIPGGTIGGLYFNDNFEITKIVINISNVLVRYPDNINERMKKFIGAKLETGDGIYFS